ISCDSLITVSGLTMHLCTAYEDLSEQEVENVRVNCPNIPFSSSHVVATCSTANVLGFCTLPAGSGTAREAFYAEGDVTADLAEQGCDQAGGTWTPNE